MKKYSCVLTIVASIIFMSSCNLNDNSSEPKQSNNTSEMVTVWVDDSNQQLSNSSYLIESSEICKHCWLAATCTEPKTCSVCGGIEGTALGHSWVEATCTAPKTCSICGEIEGTALEHSWQEATCTEPKTCTSCGETVGEATGHTWVDATCTEPKTCSICGLTSGKATGHKWKDATFSNPEKCTECGITRGEPLNPTIQISDYCNNFFSCDIDNDGEIELIEVNWFSTTDYEDTYDPHNVIFKVFNTVNDWYEIDVGEISKCGLVYVVQNNNLNGKIQLCWLGESLFTIDDELVVGQIYDYYETQQMLYFIGKDDKQVSKSEYLKYWDNLIPIYSFSDPSFEYFYAIY